MTHSTAIDTQFSSGTNLTLCPEPKELFVIIKDVVVDHIIEHGLSRTQSKLFFYFFKLDRFGDRPAKISAASVSLAIGIGKTAYYNAIAYFQKMGWFDFTDVETEVSNNSTRTKKSAKTNSDSAKTNSDSAKTNSDSAKTNSDSAKTNSNSAKTESKKLKALPLKDSKTPQTLQTFSDFNQNNQTLSEAMRERNLILWKNLEESDRNEVRCYARSVAIPKLPIKPTLEEKWIASQCSELLNQCHIDFEFQKAYYELKNSNSSKGSANSPTVENQEDTSKVEPRDTVDW